MKKLAIIGGAGPHASALLYRKFIDASSKKGAWQDHEFPYLVVFNVPFAPMMHSKENNDYIVSQLQEVINHCVLIGVTDITFACNTLHAYVVGIDFKSIKFHSLMDALIQKLAPIEGTMIVLGTAVTKHCALYSPDYFIYPEENDMQFISTFIEMVLKQQDSRDLVVPFFDYINKQKYPIVLGCTELSVLYDKYKYLANNIIIDPLDCIIDTMLCTQSMENFSL